MDILAMEQKINKLIMDNHITGGVVGYNEKAKKISVEVIWGDWKHEHGRLDWLMKKEFPNLRSIHTSTLEEDGSDCYSAVHCYYFD